MDGTLPEHKSKNLYPYFLEGRAKKVWVAWGSMIDDSKASIRRSIYELEDRYKVDTNNLIKAVVNAQFNDSLTDVHKIKKGGVKEHENRENRLYKIIYRQHLRK